MPNILTKCKTDEKLNVLSNQKPLLAKHHNSIVYGLTHNVSLDTILCNLQLIEMYDWLNKNNCCSKYIKCNFIYQQETLRFLNTINININTKTCC